MADQDEVINALRDMVNNLSPEKIQQIITAAKNETPTGKAHHAYPDAAIDDKVEAIYRTLKHTSTQAYHHLEHELQTLLSAREGDEKKKDEEVKLSDTGPVPETSPHYETYSSAE